MSAGIKGLSRYNFLLATGATAGFIKESTLLRNIRTSHAATIGPYSRSPVWGSSLLGPDTSPHAGAGLLPAPTPYHPLPTPHGQLSIASIFAAPGSQHLGGPRTRHPDGRRTWLDIPTLLPELASAFPHG